MATSPPTGPAVPERLAAARGALERHAWQEAFDGFNAADAESPLGGPDLEALAEAAFFTADVDVRERAYERAFKAHLAAGDQIRAAAAALGLAIDVWIQGRTSIASAWTQRAARLLDGSDGTYAHGYLAIARSFGALAAGRFEEAVTQAEEGVRIGSQVADPDVQAVALIALGRLKIGSGATEEGLALLEEATAAAVNDELSPYLTGMTYCTMISACRDLNDYERASQWTEETERWCERSSIAGFPGVCRIHRAEIVALGGDLPRAKLELERAAEELARYKRFPPLGDGMYAIGEVKLRLGDLDGAEAALREANTHGHTPQPAFAQILMARGDSRGALRSLDSELAETPDLWVRARLLPAHVEIALGNGRLSSAAASAAELGEILATHDTVAARARTHDAAGRVALAEGRTTDALRELRSATASWREVGAPYEIARDRLVMGSAHEALEDYGAVDLELATARAEFERLGAPLDLAAADAAIAAVAQRRSGPAQARKTFVFTDIVGSTALLEAIGDNAWSDLRRWHDETLRRCVTHEGGEEVDHTGDGFFVSFGDAASAVSCAREIQRRLAEHRRDHGFAPQVRIGLHAAEATRAGSNYTGMGVHLAARVGAVAGTGEIIASATSVDGLKDLELTDRRSVTLKGIAAPVEIVSIGWR
jgi:class 3 adenylate cyclase